MSKSGAKFKGKAGKITPTNGYRITATSARVRGHWESVVEVDVERYEVAYNGHGPFVTLGIFDNENVSIPRARMMLTPDQARELVWCLTRALKGES